MSQRQVIVVGAGLAGLCCARAIQRAGHVAHVYEASDGVGGRVRTDIVDGFRLDRGFQVMFTAYPAIRQEMDLDALELQRYEPGAIVYWQDKAYTVADPLRAPSKMLASATSPLFGIGDKLNVVKLTAALGRMSIAEIFAMPDKTMGEYLREQGFSEAFLDRFIRPFFGGIFLERGLQTSARMFAFVFKMLVQGDTALPADGMGALGQQLADGLQPGTLHLNSPVESLTRQGDRVTGVRLMSGETVEADRVVLATEADNAARLTGRSLPVTWRQSTTVYFALPERPYREKLLLLFSEPDSFVNSASLVTNVAPAHAPPGQHLLSATVLGLPEQTDAQVTEGVKAHFARYFPKSDTSLWQLLRVYRVGWAQFAQTVGVFDALPGPQTDTPGLILAGEYTASSSLDGALRSGQIAAGLAMSVKA